MRKASPDAILRARVLAELDWDSLIDESQVDVEVSKGVVTLVGTVGSYAEKLAAQDAARVIDGVHNLINGIDVKPRAEMHPSDEDLSQMVGQVLTWDALVPDAEIDISVEDGWVTLGGSCKTTSQRREAERSISHLAGIRGVHNEIGVALPEISTQSVRELISKALTRRAAHRADHIDVIVDGRSVTLTGQAQSVKEKVAILGAVTHAPGIDQVLDEVHVGPNA